MWLLPRLLCPYCWNLDSKCWNWCPEVQPNWWVNCYRHELNSAHYQWNLDVTLWERGLRECTCTYSCTGLHVVSQQCPFQNILIRYCSLDCMFPPSPTQQQTLKHKCNCRKTTSLSRGNQIKAPLTKWLEQFYFTPLIYDNFPLQNTYFKMVQKPQNTEEHNVIISSHILIVCHSSVFGFLAMYLVFIVLVSQHFLLLLLIHAVTWIAQARLLSSDLGS